MRLQLLVALEKHCKSRRLISIYSSIHSHLIQVVSLRRRIAAGCFLALVLLPLSCIYFVGPKRWGYPIEARPYNSDFDHRISFLRLVNPNLENRLIWAGNTFYPSQEETH